MMADTDTFGEDLIEALDEVLAHRRGEIALPMRNVKVGPELVKRVRAATGLSRARFEKAYGIPARTLQDWEQGRREPDMTARAYLTAIERKPKEIAEALGA